jgi:CRISPR-associated protein Cas5h
LEKDIGLEMIIEFDLWADYGHFSHPATIYSSLTYPVPPKTTIMGFLASVGGLNSVEEYSFLNRMGYSCVIKQLDGKENFCFNGIKDALPSIKKTQQHIKQRKQFYRELLVNPRYKIFIDFSECLDESIKIIENLKNHISLYQPYLGINFCLANFEFVAEHQPKITSTNQPVSIDSFVTLDTAFEIEFDKNYSDIRMATTVEEGRVFGGFSDLLVELSGKTILAKPKEYVEIDDYKLIMI